MDLNARNLNEKAETGIGVTRGEISQAGYDIVAHLRHNRISKLSKAKFKRYRPVSQLNSFVYALDYHNIGNDNVICLGKEVHDQLDCDYALAVVNRSTKLVDYVPVKFVKFEKVFSRDPNATLGLKPPPKVDYSVDNNLTADSWAEKRRALTSGFGSAKKLKMQESAIRRQIKDETLKTMMDNSALFSPVADNGGDVKSISMLAVAESAVLPKANKDAVGPNDVYSLDIFYSGDELEDLRKVSTEFWSKSNDQLSSSGVSSIVLKLLKVTSPSSDKAIFLLLLSTMCSFYKLVGGYKKSQVTETEWLSLSYPAEFMTKTRELFLSSSFQKIGRRRSSFAVSTVEKDKLLSHIICLGLLLTDGMSIPITPWSRELKCREGKISRIAEALGCKIEKLSPVESVRLETIHLARLVGPPAEKKTARRKSINRRK